MAPDLKTIVLTYNESENGGVTFENRMKLILDDIVNIGEFPRLPEISNKPQSIKTKIIVLST